MATPQPVSGGSLSGKVGSDDVTFTAGSAVFTQSDVADGISVVYSGFGLSGTDAAKYIINQPAVVSANITAWGLTITNITVNNKGYDGTTTASFSGATLTGAVDGDKQRRFSLGYGDIFLARSGR